MSRQLTREFFERQAAELGILCQVRRAARKSEKSIYLSNIRRMAHRVAKDSEAKLFTKHDKELMAELHEQGISIEEIAKKFDTDCLTTVLIIEGYA